MRNGFATLRYANKDLFKCGVRSNACASAECGVRNAEQPYGVRSAESGTTSLRFTSLTRKSLSALLLFLDRSPKTLLFSLWFHALVLEYGRLWFLDEVVAKKPYCSV